MKFWFASCLAVLLFTGAVTFVVLGTASTPPPLVVTTSNKTAAPTEGKFPKLVFETLEKKVSNVAQFQKGQTAFAIANEGEIDLVLTSGKTSCTCVGAHFRELAKPGSAQKPVEMATLKLPPGGKGEFVLDWDSKDHYGKFTVSAAMNSDDPLQTNIAFRVELEVKMDVIVVPALLSFGRLAEGQTARQSAHLYSQVLEDFQVLSVSPVDPNFKATIKPIAPSKLEEFQAVAGAEVEITLDGPMPVGPFNTTVRVETNSEQTKFRNIDVTGSVYGAFEVLPSHLDFKVVSGKKQHTKEVKVFAHNLKDDQKLTIAESSVNFLDAKLVQDKDHPTYWRLVVTVPEDAPKGKFDGTVTVDDGSGKANVRIQVSGYIRDEVRTTTSGA